MSARERIAKKCRKKRCLIYIWNWIQRLPDPADAIREDTFHQRSCARWAAWEAFEAIKKSDEKPITVLERLIKQMDEYSTQDSPHAHMFSIGYDTLMNMYDVIFVNGK